MKKGSTIYSLGVYENGDVPEVFQNIFRETQDLEMPGMADSGSEICCQKKKKKGMNRMSLYKTVNLPLSHTG